MSEKAIGRNGGTKMYVNEYGDSSRPKIILLHPMEITGEELYGLFLPHLRGEYCVIAPDQGGHGRSGRYVSLEDEADTLRNYLLGKGYKDIKLLYGASMGGSVAYELMKDPAFNFEKIWFDGVTFKESADLMYRMMTKMFIKKLRQVKEDSDAMPESLMKKFGPEFAPIMLKNFAKLTEEDIVPICYACTHREMVPLPKELQMRTHLDWGSKELDLKPSRKGVKKYLPYAEKVIRKGYNHCEYMASHTKEYIEEVEKFIVRPLLGK